MPKGVGATFCRKTGPFFSCACSKPAGIHVCPRRSRPYSAAKQGRSFRVAALSWVLSLRIEKLTLECSCVPKGVGPHSAAKQGRSVRVPALNHPGSICAHGGRGHVLQQNRAVLSCGCSKLYFALHKPGKIWLNLQYHFCS